MITEFSGFDRWWAQAAAHLYSAMRRWDHRRKTARPAIHAPVPVISVGNITVGGTAKTPMVAWLAHWFASQGKRAAVLSRGYMGSATGPERVPPDGNPLRWGDEPVMLARQGLTVWVAKERERAVAPAAADSDVLIIDDGFQRVQIARDLDLVCFGASGVGNGRMLPAGILRDPISELARADAFVGAVATLPAFYPDTPRFDFSVRRLVFTPGPPGPGARVAALAAIAAPSRFFAALRAAGIAPVIEVPLPDHHPLLPVSQQKLSRRLHASGVSHLVVTEKDAVKLPASLDGIAVVVARADFGPTDASTLAHFHGFLRARLAR